MPNVFGHNQLEMMEEEEWDGPGAGETPQGWLSPSFTNLRTPIPPGTPNLLQNTNPEASRATPGDPHGGLSLESSGRNTF